MNQKKILSARRLMAVILQALQDRPSVSHDDLSLIVASRCESRAQGPVRIASAQVRRQWNRRFRQGVDQLRRLGLLYHSDPGVYRCTDLGRQVAAENLPEITRDRLRRRFPDFIHWEYRERYGNFPPPDAPRPPLVIQRPGRAGLKVIFNLLMGFLITLPASESFQGMEEYVNF